MTKPIIPYIGGKTRLLKEIIPRIPKHTTYVEPFCGGAAVLLEKEPSKIEVLNDINGDLVNLYRVVQNHLQAFVECFKYALVSRELFEIEKNKDPDTLTDIQRAVRFFYIQKNCFGGKIKAPSFGISKNRPPAMNLLRIEEDLSAMHLRLARVLIENLKWQECVRRFDKAETFFFCDPPYWQTEGYTVQFPWEEYKALLELLRTSSGKILITLNDHPDIAELFKDYIVGKADIKYALNSIDNKQKKTELFIANYEVEA